MYNDIPLSSFLPTTQKEIKALLLIKLFAVNVNVLAVLLVIKYKFWLLIISNGLPNFSGRVT